MLYIVTLITCLVLAIWYDILGHNQYRQGWYLFLYLWLTVISAIQFQVGTDIPLYMNEYESFNVRSFTFADLFEGGEDRRQPGYILLLFICKSLSNNFVLLKAVQAVFINVAVFTFFKHETNYTFLCILLYCVINYFVINFNVMRQSFSIGFGLYAIMYLNSNKYLKYFLCVFGAYMFHNSAFLLILPLFFKILRFNKTTILLTIGLVVGFFVFITQIDITEVLLNTFSSGLLDENVSSSGVSYMSQDKLGIQQDATFFSLTNLWILTIICIFLILSKNIQLTYMSLMYFILVVISSYFPILWRFRLYFDMSYIIVLSRVITQIKIPKIKPFFGLKILLLSLTLYIGIREYFYGSEMTLRYIDQYYPYHTIFNPIIEADRLNYFK